MRYVIRYEVVREDGGKIQVWHREAIAHRCYILTPGHRTVYWEQRLGAAHVKISVRVAAASLHDASIAAEKCLQRLALPYTASIVSVEPTVHRPTA